MNFKKIGAAASALALAAGIVTALPNVSDNSAVKAASDYNYAEALQKSMFFYEVQQAGKLPDWNYVAWKGDSMCDEDGNETDVVPGGWFDAGDHFKFTLTNAYSASVIAWGYLQYKDAVDKAGLGEVYRNNIQWALDFIMQCDRGDKIIGTIGDFEGGSTDHNIWCSSEVYMRKHHLNSGDWERPYDEIADSTTIALSAAALAEGYLIFKDTQPDKAKAYLEQAEKYFKTADKIRDNENGAMGSMYKPSSWVDDCMYAANWLYMATGDQKYLDLCESDYIPKFPTENQSTDKKFTWGFCWDDTTQGAALLYAINTGKKDWADHIAKHLDYWMGEGGAYNKIQYTPDGLAYLMNWGSLRHASNTAWIAMLACDTIFKDDASKADKYNKWAKGQMDYCFGDNNLGLCYVLGMGEKNPTAIHHRTASGIHDDHWNDLGQEGSNEGWQTEYAHTLYGALVGGPNSSGEYTNNVSQYEYSEVAIDYNAGFTAALCAMVDDFGGEILADFPPTETPKWAEWEIAAVLNNGSDSKTEVKAWAMNHTAWPARVEKNVSYRYYFDITETLAAGLTLDQIKVECGSQQYQEGQQGFATVSGPHLYKDNIYYAEVKFDDARAIQPTGQSEHRDEVQFRIVIPDAIDGKSTKGAWDPTNDWSYEGLTKTTDIKSPESINDHITMYVNDKLVWGTEPDGTTAEYEAPVKPTNPSSGTTTATTTKPAETTTTTVSSTSTTTTINSSLNPQVWVPDRDEYMVESEHGISKDTIVEATLYADKNGGDVKDLTYLEIAMKADSPLEIIEVYEESPAYSGLKFKIDEKNDSEFNIIMSSDKAVAFKNNADALMFDINVPKNISEGTYSVSFDVVKALDGNGNDVTKLIDIKDAKIKVGSQIVTTTVTTTKPTTTTTVTSADQPEPTNPVGKVLYGDANCDGKVNISDAVAIMSYVTNPDAYGLSAQGITNSDVYMLGDGVNNMDALSVQKYVAQVIEILPES